MTCIIGLVEDGKVFIGGDSLMTAGWTIRTSKMGKVFFNGNFLVGIAGSPRMGQILHYMLEIPTADVYDERYMVEKFIPAVMEKFKDLGYSPVKDNVQTGGFFLIGIRKHLYKVESDFQVTQSTEGFEVIGSGEEFALGAMKAMEKIPADERIRRALEISAYFSPYVRGPFKVLST